MTNYEKGKDGILGLTVPRLPQAIKNSKEVLADREAGGTDNPSTMIHELIEYLQDLKKHSYK